MASCVLNDLNALCGVSGGSSPPRRAFKSFNAQLAIDYPLHVRHVASALRDLEVMMDCVCFVRIYSPS